MALHEITLCRITPFPRSMYFLPISTAISAFLHYRYASLPHSLASVLRSARPRKSQNHSVYGNEVQCCNLGFKKCQVRCKKMKSKVFPCSYTACSKIYSSFVNLKRHMDCIHLRLKDFACTVCGKRLSSKQNYREHLYIHTGEKPFYCVRCGLSFRQGSQLSQHKKTHKSSGFTERCSQLRLTDLLSASPDRFFNPKAKWQLFEVSASMPCFALPALLLPEKPDPCLHSDSSTALF